MNLWPFKSKARREDEVRAQVSAVIHKRIEKINELVDEIRGDNMKTKNLNGSKHTTG
jgi:hypothetical protein